MSGKQLGKSNIEYADYCFNPVWGCKRGCEYCYAQKANDKFQFIPDFTEPEFFPEKLDQPANTKKPGVVVAGFQTDLFGEWVPDEWIRQVFEACNEAPQHQYLFLTKNPSRYFDIWYRPTINSLFGVTIDSQQAADTLNRSRFMVSNFCSFDWISFEPLFGDVAQYINFKPLKWVVIGGQTKPDILPKKQWVDNIIKQADKYSIPVFMKDSLAPLYPVLRREVPWEVPVG